MTPDGSEFNFDLARERLQKLRSALEQSSELTPEVSQRLLDERASAYARAPERVLLASEQIEILTFELAGEHYAVESRFVSEVLRAPAITDVPGTPDLLCGVTNLRGEIMAVMDIGQLLGSPHPGNDCPWVLVLGHDRPELGVVVQTVTEVKGMRTEALRPPSRASREISREWIRGVTADAVIVLDGNKLLEDRRLHLDMPEA